ncbi:PLD nuclease N-terminal domain-containing protein [Georgenia sunbinii]|uniref:PLD nuclease N-terminal domain-containing protein n=1 Tax=Georgenia sunbinii TaxID=3117728 RepID=UPI002F261DCC
MRYLPFILILALTIYALVDCVRNDDSDMPVALPKGVWLLLIVLFPAIGPITWLVVSRASRQTAREGGTVYRSSSAGYQRPARPSRPPRMRPVAPDDDPDFLASLDLTPPAPAPDPAGPTSDPAAADDDTEGSADPDEPDDGHDSGPHANPGPSARP